MFLFPESGGGSGSKNNELISSAWRWCWQHTHTHTHKFSFSFFLSYTQTQRQLPRSILGRIFHLSPADFTVTHCKDSGLLKSSLPCLLPPPTPDRQPLLAFPLSSRKEMYVVSKEGCLRLWACVRVCAHAWHCGFFVKIHKCVRACLCHLLRSATMQQSCGDLQ